jgi:hypothetical protein
MTNGIYKKIELPSYFFLKKKNDNYIIVNIFFKKAI